MSATNFKPQPPVRVAGLNAPHLDGTPTATSLSATVTASSSSGPSDSFVRWLESPSLESQLDRYIELKRLEKEIQAELAEITGALDLLVEAGEAAEEMEWNGYKITRRIRKSYVYPDYITKQRDQLKAAEKLSVALGEAKVKLTRFYEARAL